MTYASDMFAATARRLHEHGRTWEEIATAARITEENAEYLTKEQNP